MKSATEAEKEPCYGFIRENMYATVATISVDNTPNAAYVSYIVDEYLQFYF
jgi:hypothetical protein